MFGRPVSLIKLKLINSLALWVPFSHLSFWLWGFLFLVCLGFGLWKCLYLSPVVYYPAITQTPSVFKIAEAIRRGRPVLLARQAVKTEENNTKDYTIDLIKAVYDYHLKNTIVRNMTIIITLSKPGINLSQDRSGTHFIYLLAASPMSVTNSKPKSIPICSRRHLYTLAASSPEAKNNIQEPFSIAIVYNLLPWATKSIL